MSTSCADLDASLRLVVSEAFSSATHLSGASGDTAELIGHRLLDLKCSTPADIRLPFSATSATCADLQTFVFMTEGTVAGTADFSIQTIYAVNAAIQRDAELGCGATASLHAYTDRSNS